MIDTLYNRLRAYFSGKKVFYIPSLKRAVFADSIEQCRLKFKGHKACSVSLYGTLNFIFF